jgi:twitching motility protein PilT
MASIVSSYLDELLSRLWDRQGTDLLLTVGAAPLLRVDGSLSGLSGAIVVTGEANRAVVRELLDARQWRDFEGGAEVDFSFTWRGEARVRGNVFHQRGNPTIALRMIPRRIPSFDELHLPVVVRGFGALQQGLVFVTGPTGSGKSTTLASIIAWINANRAVHVLTIEDPIEYLHDHQQSAISQREVGTDTASFEQALRSALREDPDVLLVGELRDLQSIRFALTLAETGHLVFATLHTNDSSQAIDRLIDVFPAEQQPQIRVQLANTLTSVVYQRLLPRIQGGLVAAYEVLMATLPVRNLIKEGKTGQLRNQLITGQRDGMVTLEMSLNTLVRDGVLSYEEAVARSLYPREITVPPGAIPSLLR